MSRFVIPEKPEALESGASGDFIAVSNKVDVTDLSEREVDRMTEGEALSCVGPDIHTYAPNMRLLRRQWGSLSRFSDAISYE